jgi:hypothetical protein
MTITVIKEASNIDKNKTKNHSNDRQQLKILVMIIVSTVVLVGTMRYQRDLQTMVLVSSQLTWGADTTTVSNSSSTSLSAANLTSINNHTFGDGDVEVHIHDANTGGDNTSQASSSVPDPPPQLSNNNLTESDAINDTDAVTDSSTNSTFHKYDGVVIATKLHGPHQQHLLDQSLCLLQAAYNRKVNYDIVVFYTEDLKEEEMNITSQLVAPARIIWAKDNIGLQEEIAALSPIRRSNFLESCKTNTSEGLDWFSMCPGRVAYNWQAEFRSWHIWNHKALAPYKTMLWLDTDGFSTREWHVDPVKTMVENDLNILFMNFPQGRGKGRVVHERTFNGLNKTICKLGVKDGHLDAEYGDSIDACPGYNIPMIHGFFHITNLDFYRRPEVLKFEGTAVGRW